MIGIATMTVMKALASELVVQPKPREQP